MTVAIATAIDVALGLVQAASQISTVIQAANAAGRATLTQEEWAGIRRLDDAARASLVAAIGDSLIQKDPGSAQTSDPAAGGNDPPSTDLSV